ncbi:hypothetical protein C8R43DRAFT_1193369 [Mycena crocata]|nr:hypothetical protein C8R43DRAFT_1193369 [Mycena crocata]
MLNIFNPPEKRKRTLRLLSAPPNTFRHPPPSVMHDTTYLSTSPLLPTITPIISATTGELGQNGMYLTEGNGTEHAAPSPFELDAIPSSDAPAGPPRKNFINFIENNRVKETAHLPPESNAIPSKFPGGAEESEGRSSMATPKEFHKLHREYRVKETAHLPPESNAILSNIPDRAEGKEGATFNTEESQPQRGHGRPRKDALPVPPRPPPNVTPVDPNALGRSPRLRKLVVPEEEKPKRPRGRPRIIIDPATNFHPYAPPPEKTRCSPRKHVEPDMSPDGPEQSIVGRKFFAAAMSADVSEAESEPDVAPFLSAPPNDNESSSQQPRKPITSQFSRHHPSNNFLLKFLTGLSLQKWVEPFRVAGFDENAIWTFWRSDAGCIWRLFERPLSDDEWF